MIDKIMMPFSKDFSWYNGWRRITIHVIFWLIAFCYEGVQTNTTLPFSTSLFIPFTLRKIITIALVYYLLMYYAVPKLLLTRKWVSFIGYLLLVYVFMRAGTYYTFYYLKINDTVPEGMNKMVNYYTKFGFIAALYQPLMIYNLMLLHATLFYAILIKITKEFFISTFQKLNLEKENLKLEKENIQLELNFLKSQVNPHFFFNTFNNIYSLIVDKDEIAADIVVRLSGLMRYTLYESSSEKIPLKKELEFIRDYVFLEKIRHKDHVTIGLQEKGDPGNLEIPPLIMVTFIENAFKHGVNNTIEASWVTINIEIADGELLFKVDNSKPKKRVKENVRGGIGIANAKRRLDMLYKDRHELKIKNDPLQYEVELQIQLYEEVPELHNNR